MLFNHLQLMFVPVLQTEKHYSQLFCVKNMYHQSNIKIYSVTYNHRLSWPMQMYVIMRFLHWFEEAQVFSF